MNVKPLLWGLAFCAAALACNSAPGEPDAEWQTMPTGRTLQAPTDSILWEVTLLSLEKAGFPLGSGLDPSSMTATSGWKVALAPFRGRGTREQAIVRYTPLGEGKYDVMVRVKRQTNETLVNQLDPTYAEWEWASDDVDVARILLQHIRARLNPSIEIRPEAADPLAPWRRNDDG